MADVSVLGAVIGAVMDFSKLKVPDLKRELKSRGLPTSGNKNDLLERLQAALKSNESVDDLDEDLLNEDDDLETTETVIKNIDAALNDSHTPKTPTKRRSHGDNNVQPVKKVILNRNPLLITDTRISTESKESSTDKSVNGDQKKVIKISEISVKERLEMRARKFDVALGIEARKIARAQRFGTAQPSLGSGTIQSNVNTSIDVLKQRAARFGGSVAKAISNLDIQEKLEKRKQRFGTIIPSINNGISINTGLSQNDKKQQRLERFKQPVK